MTTKYKDLTTRNFGYINPQLQEKISNTRVLISGCGIGSQVAEAATRIGFQKFILVDGDTIDSHNLNRQSFFFDQIGKFKVDALKENLLRINPEAQVETHTELVSSENAKLLVSKSDLIFDTIDFLDLRGIVALHDEAHNQNKILISSFSVGFGAAVISFAPNQKDHSLLREIFSLPLRGDIGSISYVERYIKLFTALAPGLDPEVLKVMQKVFKDLSDGAPCPAPQVAPGAYAVAASCVTAAIRLLGEAPITLGPEMVIVNLSGVLQSAGFQLVTTAPKRDTQSPR